MLEPGLLSHNDRRRRVAESGLSLHCRVSFDYKCKCLIDTTLFTKKFRTGILNHLLQYTALTNFVFTTLTMTTPIETAASAFGVVSLAIQLFQGCIEGYKICNSARNMGRDGDLLYTKLAVQRCRFGAWANKAGIPNGPFKRLDWDPIILILGQQLELLRSAKRLQDHYRLSSDTETLLVGSSAEQDSERQMIAFNTTNLVDRLRPLFIRTGNGRQAEADGIQARSGIVKKFSWAVMDKDKLKEIVNNITQLNDQLVEYLSQHDQETFRNDLGTFFRALISECGATDELENIRESMPPSAPSAIFAAAHIKQLRIALNFENQDNEVAEAATMDALTPVSNFKRFKARKIAPFSAANQNNIQIIPYDLDLVMVEWRTIEKNWESVHSSLRSLAVLLHEANDSSFHSLPCAGYVDEQESGRFGFVYNLNDLATGGDASSVSSLSLLALIPRYRLVSLQTRTRLAIDIAEAVLQIHNAGWLHKGICSENVVFVAASRASPRTIIDGDPKLIGYGYARPDTASAALMTELPDTAVKRDLYRHPDARGESRQSFHMRFDMYGLACVLTELALWQPLETILTKYRAPIAQQSFPSLNELHGDTDFKDELSFHVGPQFVKAIGLCLTSSGLASGQLEKSVLDALRLCGT